MTALLSLIARTIAALAVLACLALPSSGRSEDHRFFFDTKKLSSSSSVTGLDW